MNDLAADTVDPAPADPPAADTAAPPAQGSTPSLISGGEQPPAATESSTDAVPPATQELVTRESLTLPEGVIVDEEVLTQFLETVNTDGLSRAEVAQKFIDLQLSLNEKVGAAATEAAQELWDKTQAEWISQCRALPEIGGDRLPSTLETIKRGLISAGADDKVFEALNLTGAGSHPAIVQLMHKLVQPFVEPAPVAGDPPKGSLSAALKLYPTMAPKE